VLCTVATYWDAVNGYFIAAPRRTGKSTFLQVDLKPLEKSGVAVGYVDLLTAERTLQRPALAPIDTATCSPPSMRSGTALSIF
jgi:hypothetical protein